MGAKHEFIERKPDQRGFNEGSAAQITHRCGLCGFFYVITSGKDLAERKQGTLVANSAMR